MMDWTDTHCRVFHRVIAPHARVYTEMVHANAVIHGDRARLLAMDPVEHPVALQLGGSEPALLAQAARIGAEHGFDEINLNCGCPSDRVQAGRFGACLMREPSLVAEGVAAMIEAVASLPGPVPVTVKCRLGVDDDHDRDRFMRFIDTVAEAGCGLFVVHARNAWLKGLSPKENREVPPLRYEWAYRLKAERPALHVVVNGGIATLEYVTKLFRGIGARKRVYGGDFFTAFGVWGLAETNDYLLRDTTLFRSLPLDLYVNAGLRVDTDLGRFEFSFANALGRLR